MLTKLGKSLQQRVEDSTAANTGIALVGGSAIRNQLAAGNLTGRETLYHGTNPTNKASILRDGLQPTTEANAVNTNVLKAAKPEVFKDALGKSYLTRSKLEAAQYTVGGKYRDPVTGALIKNPNIGEFFEEAVKGDGRVNANVPLWKMKTVRNPESAMGYSKWKSDLGLQAMFAPEHQLKSIYKSLDDAVVVDGAIDSKYLKGSANYTRNSAREIADFMRNNKLRAAKGLGAAGLGGLGVYYGGRNLVNKLHPTEKHRITKTAQNLEEQGYVNSWKGKLRAAKETTPKYVAGQMTASALHGGIVGAGGALLSTLMSGGRKNVAQSLVRGLKAARYAAPAAALSGAAYGMAEAPIEYAYTKGFVPSRNPLKSMLGYVQTSDDIKKKYVTGSK